MSVLECSCPVEFSSNPNHGSMVMYGSILAGFPLGTVPGTCFEVPSDPYRYQRVTCKLYRSLIGLRKSPLLRH